MMYQVADAVDRGALADSTQHPEVDKAVLRELYEVQGLAIAKIATQTGRSTRTVHRLQHSGIPTRRITAGGPTPTAGPNGCSHQHCSSSS